VLDTHCHLLPGLDDGPATPDDAMWLARALVADGMSAVVATPHLSRRYPTDHAAAVARLDELRTMLQREAVPLEVFLGAELTPARAISEPAEVLHARSVAGTHLLVEAEPTTPRGVLRALVEHVSALDLIPIVAHPERCSAVRRDRRVVDDLRAMGALIQVVAPSLIGGHANGIGETAWRLIAAGRVDMVASDAHGARRPPVMTAAAREVESRFGADARLRLFATSPSSVLGAMASHSGLGARLGDGTPG
jgi:protein-tyrosine phosphatase